MHNHAGSFGRHASLSSFAGKLKKFQLSCCRLFGAPVVSVVLALSCIQANPAKAHDRSETVAIGSGSELFGSVPLRFGPIQSAQWQRLPASEPMVSTGVCSGSDGLCATKLGRDVIENRKKRLRMPLREVAQDVNSSVNRILTYRTDREAYGKVDHWATFLETARNGAGDCEDYAIAKMWILEKMGVPLSAMRLVVLLDSRLGRYHAVLALRSGETWLVLDSATDKVMRDEDVAQYVPVYSLSSTGSWIHGFRSDHLKISLQGKGSVYPGEAHRE